MNSVSRSLLLLLGLFFEPELLTIVEHFIFREEVSNSKNVVPIM